jgi:cytosine/adenosine deaminase-related metal-dependent hydrolase
MAPANLDAPSAVQWRRVQGGTLVTMDPLRRVLRADLWIRGARIAALGDAPPPQLQTDQAAGEVQVDLVDATDALVVPGLVQAHVHLCQTLCRGHADDLPLLEWLRERVWPYEAALDEEALGAAAELGCLELIRGGTTALLDMGTVHHHDVVFEVLERAGLRAKSGKAMMDTGDGAPAGLRETTARSLAESERLFQRWDGAAQGRLGYAFAPRFVLSCSRELLEATTGAAQDRRAHIHTHASESAAEAQLVRALCGDDNIAFLHRLGMAGPRVVLAHGVWPTDRELTLMAESGTHIAHCPSSNLKLGSGIAPVPELLERGVNVALGADGAPCNNNLDAFQELRLAALLHKPRRGPQAMAAARAFELATLGGARALGLAQAIGSLEVGKLADVVVVSAARPHIVPTEDPYSALAYSARADDVRTVLVGGRPLLREGRVLTLDEPAVLERARRERRRIAGCLAA